MFITSCILYDFIMALVAQVGDVALGPLVTNNKLIISDMQLSVLLFKVRSFIIIQSN